MKVLKKSDDGRVVIVERLNGLAVSVLEPVWNARGRVMLNEWQTRATGLDQLSAERLFTQLAA